MYDNNATANLVDTSIQYLRPDNITINVIGETIV